MKYHLIVFLLSSLISITSCKNSESYPDLSVVDEIEEVNALPKIVFLTYTIKKNIDASYTILLKNKLITEGRLKEKMPLSSPAIENNLQVLLTDRNELLLDSFVLSNPLIKDVEFVDESGKFLKKTIYLDSIDFSVRFQLDENTSFVGIEKINAEGQSNTPLIQNKL